MRYLILCLALIASNAFAQFKYQGGSACTTATTAVQGCVKPDGTTITISNGVISSSGGVASSIAPGTTTITGGTSGSFEYNNAGVLGEKTPTGTGNVVLSNSPTLVTPALGTPSSGVATNLTGTATALNIGGNAATVTTNANLTGDVTSAGNATTLATVNSGSGSVGSSTAIPVLTTNAKGLVTAQSTASVIAPAGTLTGTTLASGVTGSSLTSAAGGAFGTGAYANLSAPGTIGAVTPGIGNFTALSSTLGVVFPSTTFASLPAASSVATGAEQFVSDVGIAGSSWKSDGTNWNPVNGVVNHFSSGIPIIFSPSGNIAVTSGINTLGTALDTTYTKAYICLPAGAWTGSAAGCYYTVCSSTTSCTQYSNQYTSGVPTVPGSPTLVTTGAGAYTQTTGSYVTGMTFPIIGNTMGVDGKLDVDFLATNNTTAGSKFIEPVFNTSALTATHQTTISPMQNKMFITNQGATNAQFYLNSQGNYGSSSSGNMTVDTTSNQNLIFKFYLTVATDWIVLQYVDAKLYR